MKNLTSNTEIKICLSDKAIRLANQRYIIQVILLSIAFIINLALSILFWKTLKFYNSNMDAFPVEYFLMLIFESFLIALVLAGIYLLCLQTKAHRERKQRIRAHQKGLIFKSS